MWFLAIFDGCLGILWGLWPARIFIICPYYLRACADFFCGKKSRSGAYSSSQSWTHFRHTPREQLRSSKRIVRRHGARATQKIYQTCQLSARTSTFFFRAIRADLSPIEGLEVFPAPKMSGILLSLSITRAADHLVRKAIRNRGGRSH